MGVKGQEISDFHLWKVDLIRVFLICEITVMMSDFWSWFLMAGYWKVADVIFRFQVVFEGLISGII